MALRECLRIANNLNSLVSCVCNAEFFMLIFVVLIVLAHFLIFCYGNKVFVCMVHDDSVFPMMLDFTSLQLCTVYTGPSSFGNME